MKSFRIGSVFGIPIKLDLTFLLILPVFAYLIGNQLTGVVDLLDLIWEADISAAALSTGWTPWLLGLVAALGLFAGVLLHELGHSVTAQRYGYPIDSITLWLLGGIAALSEMPENWRQELNIAIAGPIVSVLVGVASYAGFALAPAVLGDAVSATALDGVRFVLGYLAVLNVALAVFNMIPAFPMDGGRILRALLSRSQPYARATQQAASVGKTFAFVMGLFGLLAFNVVLIAIALFIYIAASSESQQVTMRAAFQDVTVADLMTPVDELDTVTPETSVADLIQRMVTERHTGYPVLEDGRLVGVVTLSDAREVRAVERDAYTVEEIMSTDLQTILPRSDAMRAIERMQDHDIGRLLVVEDARPAQQPDGSGLFGTETPARRERGAGEGDLVGIISRTDVMTTFNILQQSGTLNPASEAHPSD